MFGLLHNLYKWYKSHNEKIVKFALIGIDNAGKTTILARLKGEVPEFITPTIGFASETIEQGKYHIKIFDLGGGGNIRSIWSSYYAEIHGAIFVVDSADKDRLNTAREVLHAVLDHPRIQKKPLLIFSNKQDLPEALPGPDISEELQLDKFTDFSYNIVSCTAVLVEDGGAPDPNISEGLKWLLDMVDRHFPSLERRIQVDVAEQAEQDRIEKEEKKKRVEAMRRERELERERKEKEEEQNINESSNESKPMKEWLSTPQKSQSIIEVHTSDGETLSPVPSIEGIGMTKEDFRNSSSSLLNSTRKSSTLSLTRSTPRNTVSPLIDSPASAPSPALSALSASGSSQSSARSNVADAGSSRSIVDTGDAVAFTPRSAWSSSQHVPPSLPVKKKLDPLTLPSPSLQGL